MSFDSFPSLKENFKDQICQQNSLSITSCELKTVTLELQQTLGLLLRLSFDETFL